MNTKTKKITEGAMIAAMFGALSLINTYTASTFDLFILYGMVIPIVYYGYHYSLQDNIIVSITSIIVIFITGVPYFCISAIFSCIEGIYVAECLRRICNKRIILLGVIVFACINNVLLYEVFSSLVGLDITQEIQSTYSLLSPYIGNTISLNQMLSLIPLIILLMGILEGYVIILICNLVLPRLHIGFPHNYHLSSMHLSKTSGLLLLLMIAVGIYGYKISSITYYEYLYLVGLMVLMLQGLSFVSYYCICHYYPNYIQIILFLSIFIPLVIYVYVILGIVDIFLDIRGNYGK